MTTLLDGCNLVLDMINTSLDNPDAVTKSQLLIDLEAVKALLDTIVEQMVED